MRRPVGVIVNLEQLADELAYDKGQALLAMFEQWLGSQTFRAGVVAYLSNNAWGNAVGSDLWSELSLAAGRDVSGPMSAFLDQPGVPLVSADVLPDGRVRLRQQRFLGSGLEAEEDTRWKVPIHLAYSDGRRSYTQDVLLSEAERVVTLEKSRRPAWVHPKAGERGYYRWTVPPAEMEKLAEAAPTALGTAERVGFLLNAAALLDGGLIHGDEYLRLLERFAVDRDPEVISTVVNALRGVHEWFITPDLERPFAARVRELLGPTLRRIGMAPRSGEPEAVTLLRPRLISLLGERGQDPAVLAYAGTLARAYLETPAGVDASLAGTALSLAARNGDRALFEQYRSGFEKTEVPAERSRFLSGLASFRDSALIELALDYSLKGPLRPQELWQIPFGIAETGPLRERSWRWMSENYETLARRLPPLYLTGLAWFAYDCSTARLEQARRFFATPPHHVPGIDEELAKIADRAKTCAGLREREGAAVAKSLNRESPTR